MPPDSTTIKQCLAGIADDRKDAFTRRPEDGFAISVLKILFGWRFLWGWYYFALLFFCVSRKLTRQDNTLSVKLRIHQSVEYYVYSSLVVLLIIYAWLYSFTEIIRQQGPPAPILPVAIALVIVIYRLLDLISVTVYYNFARPVEFQAAVPPRTLLLVIANYLEITLAFAIFYLLLHFSGDKFSAKTWPGDFADTFFTPVYFSFVTITTLGFGDFSPDCWPGRMCVVFEVGFGFVLLLVVLQRVLGARRTPFV